MRKKSQTSFGTRGSIVMSIMQCGWQKNNCSITTWWLQMKTDGYSVSQLIGNKVSNHATIPRHTSWSLNYKRWHTNGKPGQTRSKNLTVGQRLIKQHWSWNKGTWSCVYSWWWQVWWWPTTIDTSLPSIGILQIPQWRVLI